MRGILLFTLVLAGCGPSADEKMIVEGKAAVASHLRDPGSATFRNLTLFKPTTLCGEVNAKNGFGGYAGFEAFVYDGRNKIVKIHETVLTDDEELSRLRNIGFQAMHSAFCKQR